MLIQLCVPIQEQQRRTNVNDDPRAPNAFINMKPFGL